MKPRRLFHTLRNGTRTSFPWNLQINRLHWSPSSIYILGRETGDTENKEKIGRKMNKISKRQGERNTGIEPAFQAWEARALPIC